MVLHSETEKGQWFALWPHKKLSSRAKPGNALCVIPVQDTFVSPMFSPCGSPFHRLLPVVILKDYPFTCSAFLTSGGLCPQSLGGTTLRTFGPVKLKKKKTSRPSLERGQLIKKAVVLLRC